MLCNVNIAGTLSTTNNEEIARNPYAPKGFRRRRGICCVGAPRRCPASPASHRLASSPAALGTRPVVLLPRVAREHTLKSILSCRVSKISKCVIVGLQATLRQQGTCPIFRLRQNVKISANFCGTEQQSALVVRRLHGIIEIAVIQDSLNRQRLFQSPSHINQI
jgi:hypothetical protein